MMSYFSEISVVALALLIILYIFSVDHKYLLTSGLLSCAGVCAPETVL